MFGRLADLYGRKRVFMLGSAWLAIFTLACGFAHSKLDFRLPSFLEVFQQYVSIGAITLDVLRGLMGIGVAASIPASV